MKMPPVAKPAAFYMKGIIYMKKVLFSYELTIQ